jgi:diketogulonate reductase-like aldo/keto reductase
MQLLTASIPSSGQTLPRLGLGTYRSFDQDPGRLAQTELPQVLQAFYDAGGRLLDSSPMYGQAEAVSGRLSLDLGLNDGLFMATKVWTQGAEAGREQMEQSLQRLGRSKLELMQVHNLLDWEAHWPLLQDWKAAGRLRYIGITHYNTQAFDRLAQVLRSSRVDFLQIPYSLAETTAEQSLLPLAADKGVAVIANEPFDQGGLFGLAQGRAVPAWVGELGIYTWAQYFLKFILADERVQFVIPATSKLAHLEGFLPGGAGPLPNPEQRQRMRAEFQGGLRRQAHR